MKFLFLFLWLFLDTKGLSTTFNIFQFDKNYSTKSLSIQQDTLDIKDTNASLYIEPYMIYVNEGSFFMGNDYQGDNERPVHQVRLDNYLISIYELTVREFRKFIQATGYVTTADTLGGSYVFKGSKLILKSGINWQYDAFGVKRPITEDNHPVIHISWNDATNYAKWLSNISGKNYRLPSEAEWEFAALGGNRSEHFLYAGDNNLNSIAWYSENGDNHTHPVGKKSPNEIGIYDMTGNVWEWCSDRYSELYYQDSPRLNPEGPKTGDFRVLRGGSWAYTTVLCKVTTREYNRSDFRGSNVGFRLVCLP